MPTSDHLDKERYQQWTLHYATTVTSGNDNYDQQTTTTGNTRSAAQRRDAGNVLSGRVKADPVVAATHPIQTPEYVLRTTVEVVIKDKQAEELISKLRERLRRKQGGKIFVEDVRDAIDIPTNKREEAAI